MKKIVFALFVGVCWAAEQQRLLQMSTGEIMSAIHEYDFVVVLNQAFLTPGTPAASEASQERLDQDSALSQIYHFTASHFKPALRNQRILFCQQASAKPVPQNLALFQLQIFQTHSFTNYLFYYRQHT